MSRVSKNTVGIENFRGYYRLRLPASVAKGSSRYFSTGLSSTTENQRKAQVLAWGIEEDIAKGTFDWTLNRYKPQSANSIQAQDWIWNLDKLWTKYSDFMRPQVAETTYQKDYVRKIVNHIRAFPTKDARKAIQLRDWLLANLSSGVTKRILRYLSACCRWAVRSQLLPVNPFDGLAADIKNSKNNATTIDPFSLKERDAIIAAFESDRQYKHYAPFVKFLFFTGCRPGEACALTWSHINADCTEILFCESYDGSFKIRKTTKTGKSRRFPCNQRLTDLLIEIKPSPDVLTPNSIVFPAPRGGLINTTKFTKQIWKGYKHGKRVYRGVIPQLVESGEVNRYRTLYNARHSFITQAIAYQIPVQQVARWCGNSPEIIYRHYAGVCNDATVPEF